jgi:molybdenum cofactor cytidylyltransferase
LAVYSIILLAAGPSTRMGKPKQLLPYKKSSLLQHLIDESRKSTISNTIVVLGAFEQEIKDSLDQDGIQLVLNDEWKEGVASSIKCGVAAIQKLTPSTDAAIFLFCDQPFVTTELLDELVQIHEKTGKPIVTCAYDSRTGPPVLLHQSMFPELLQLTGDNGVGKVVEIHTGNTVSVPFRLGSVDINTMEEYNELES